MAGGQYLLTVKNNQKLLRQKLIKLFNSQDDPELYSTTEKNHGRIEKRTTSSIDLRESGITFPHAQTALKITKERTAKNGKKKEVETTITDVYLITSIPYEELSLEKGAKLARGHWSIENKLHHVKDASMMEDRSRIRNGSSRIMSAIRTLITRLFTQSKRSYAQTARYIAGNVSSAIGVVTSKSLKLNDLHFSG